MPRYHRSYFTYAVPQANVKQAIGIADRPKQLVPVEDGRAAFLTQTVGRESELHALRLVLDRKVNCRFDLRDREFRKVVEIDQISTHCACRCGHLSISTCQLWSEV